MRSRWSLPLFASLASVAFAVVTIVTPQAPAAALALAPGRDAGPVQVYASGGDHTATASRDGYTVTTAPVVHTAPAVGIPDPGTAQAIAYDMVAARGWGPDEYSCLVALWNRESHWNVYAYNPSGAYGIPQAMTNAKTGINPMSSVGADWQTNPATQITWGLNYIQGRYGSPCGAWNHSETSGWY